MWNGLRTTPLASEQEESTQERKSYGGDAIPHWATRRCFPSHFSDASVGPSVAIGIIIKITIKITVIDPLPCAKTFANNSINYNNSLWWILLLLAFGPITSWQIDGETMETETLFSWAAKSLQMVTASMKLKDACSWKKSYNKFRQHIKKLKTSLWWQSSI